MIFGPKLIPKVLDGTKTQTRRPVKCEWTPATVSVDEARLPCRYKVGKTYAVQPGRGKRGIARIKVLDVRRERWRDISVDDAVAEGFGHRDIARPDFLAYVMRLYPGLDLDAECWVIEFELVGEGRG